MSHETWYAKVLQEKRKGIVISAVITLVFAVCVAFWHFLTGAAFHWESISPIETPDLLPRLFYSALVFVGPGWFLYHKLKFWKFLYEPYRGGGRSAYREYKKVKAAFWLLLILLMYFVIVPFVVDVINAIISFFYNVYILILYLAPSAAISGLLFGGYYAICSHSFMRFWESSKKRPD